MSTRGQQQSTSSLVSVFCEFVAYSRKKTTTLYTDMIVDPCCRIYSYIKNCERQMWNVDSKTINTTQSTDVLKLFPCYEPPCH